MKFSIWTVVFYSFVESSDYKFRFSKLGLIVDDCSIVFENGQCLVLIKIDDELFEDDPEIIEACVLVEAEEIADVLSWKYNIPLKRPSVFRGDPKKIFSKSISSDQGGDYGKMFPFSLCEENKQILGAYRQMKNEPNEALRFLMSYRLVEVISRKHKIKKTDEFLLSGLLGLETVRGSRNKKDKVTLVTHLRNKIHATSESYHFPYNELKLGSRKLEGVLRKIIDDEFSRNL